MSWLLTSFTRLVWASGCCCMFLRSTLLWFGGLSIYTGVPVPVTGLDLAKNRELLFLSSFSWSRILVVSEYPIVLPMDYV